MLLASKLSSSKKIGSPNAGVGDGTLSLCTRCMVLNSLVTQDSLEEVVSHRVQDTIRSECVGQSHIQLNFLRDRGNLALR